MAQLAHLVRAFLSAGAVPALVAASVSACGGGNGERDGDPAGAAGAAGSVGQGGTSGGAGGTSGGAGSTSGGVGGTSGGVGGSSVGGSSASGAGASGGSGAEGGSLSAGGSAGVSGSGGSGGLECPADCIKLCEGGLCDCHCEASCEGFELPPFDKSCETAADCFAGIHTADCCGSVIVLGYNVAERERLTRYELDCSALAQCECPPSPPTLEGGQMTSDITLAFAECSGGQCLGNGPVMTGD